MYLNLGSKLKRIAKVLFIALLALAELAGLLSIATPVQVPFLSGNGKTYLSIGETVLAMVLAPGILWLLSMPLYILGHIVENSDIRTDLAVRGGAPAVPAPAAPAVPAPAAPAVPASTGYTWQTPGWDEPAASAAPADTTARWQDEQPAWNAPQTDAQDQGWQSADAQDQGWSSQPADPGWGTQDSSWGRSDSWGGAGAGAQPDPNAPWSGADTDWSNPSGRTNRFQNPQN